VSGPDDLHGAALAWLMEPDPDRKGEGVQALEAALAAGAVAPRPDAPPPAPVPAPGRPARPRLVPPRAVPRRGPGTPAGRVALIHALAHIEFNAINLALDAVYRFRGLPPAFYADWLRVAREEVEHFALLRGRLQALGSDYGALDAHDGLWQAAVATADDLLARMAVVHRGLEARGLDVTPGMIRRLREAGDAETAAVLERILRDEVGHVAAGTRWFRHACAARGVEPEAAFTAFARTRLRGMVKGRLHAEARRAAGFTEHELAALERARRGGPDALS